MMARKKASDPAEIAQADIEVGAIEEPQQEVVEAATETEEPRAAVTVGEWPLAHGWVFGPQSPTAPRTRVSAHYGIAVYQTARGLPVSGVFDETTRADVLTLRRDLGSAEVGILDEATWGALR